MRVAIYTAIFGNYDELKPPALQDIDCDFFCFSDALLPKRFGAWKTIYVPRDRSLHPRMQSKWFKIMNHEIFPDGRLHWKYAFRSGHLFNRQKYDATIWCDGSLKIKGSMLAREVSGLVKNGSVAVFSHPDRDCIYDEVVPSMELKKYEGLPLAAQVEHYRQAGTPRNNGLYACGIIGRQAPPNDHTIKFDSAWWQENLKWTYQDQLSFAHLVHQKKMPISVIPGHLWVNPYFDWVTHASEE